MRRTSGLSSAIRTFAEATVSLRRPARLEANSPCGLNMHRFGRRFYRTLTGYRFVFRSVRAHWTSRTTGGGACQRRRRPTGSSASWSRSWSWAASSPSTSSTRAAARSRSRPRRLGRTRPRLGRHRLRRGQAQALRQHRRQRLRAASSSSTVKEGDRVKKGQVLARIESERYEAGTRQSEAAVQAATADLDARRRPTSTSRGSSFERTKQMYDEKLVSDAGLRPGRGRGQDEGGRVESPRRRIAQLQAQLDSNRDDLAQDHRDLARWTASSPACRRKRARSSSAPRASAPP